MNRKMQWLRNKLLSMDLQGMIVSNPENIRYLTNIQGEGILLVTRKENIFLTDSRYIEDVHNTLTLFDEIVVYDMRGLSIDDYENFFMFCENVGFEENYVTYAKYKEYMHRFKINNFVETENMIEKQRMIKDEEEIESIQKACKVTDDCFEYILGYIKPGMTEKQIAREIDDYYYKNAEGTSFDTIVASGENSSKPHAVPTDRKIQEKDIITIDMGCKIDGYCSDMTRTFFVGEIPEEMKKVYDLVLKNQVQTLSYMFNNKLKGEPITKIDRPLEKYLVEEMSYSVNLIKPIIEQMRKVVEEESVHLEGANKLFELPEFNSLEVAKNFVNILDEKELMADMLSTGFAKDINVYIGEENEKEELKDFSIVTFKHRIGNKDLGTIGIIGPKRMDYAKVISVMKYISKKLNGDDNKEDKS